MTFNKINIEQMDKRFITKVLFVEDIHSMWLKNAVTI
jgi:hypothetical protein